MLKRLLALSAILAVTGLVVVYAFWDVDFGQLAALLLAGDYRILFPFLILVVLFYYFTALRWCLILRPLGRYSAAQVTPAMMIGFGGDNLLPAHMGDLVRAIVFALQYRLSRSGVFMTLVLERVLDVFAILLLFLVATFTLDTVPEGMRDGLRASAVVFGLICVGIALFLRYPAFFVRWWNLWSRPLPAIIRELGTRFLTGSEAGLAALRSPAALVPLAVLSLLKWGAAGGMVWLSLQSYGISVAPGTSALVVAASAMAVTLPSVPGYFGMIQAAFVFTLIPFGVSREAALAASVFFHIAQWIPVTLLGLVFFFTTGLGAGRVRREMSKRHDTGASPPSE